MLRLLYCLALLGAGLALGHPISTCGQDKAASPSPDPDTTARSWTIDLETGVRYDAQRDQQISPITYAGAQPFVSGGYTVRGRWTHGLRVFVHGGQRNPVVDGRRAITNSSEDVVGGGLQTFLSRQVVRRGPWTLSAEARLDAYAADWTHRFPDGRTGESGYAHALLGAGGVVQRHLGARHELSMRAGLPLGGLIIRPAYGGRELDRRMATWPRFRGMDAAIGYTVTFSDAWTGQFAYRFHLSRYDAVEDTRRLAHAFIAGFSFIL